MSPTHQKIQIVLILTLIVVGIRTGYILYERHGDAIAGRKQTAARNVGYSNPDYYVVPKKLYPYDLKSAKQLTQQPVWVQVGYHYTYYPYNPETKKVDFDHDGGLLLPIEKLSIKDVVKTVHPGKDVPPQVVAIFEKDGKDYAVPIGLEKDDQFKIYSDQMFFIQDPHELYKNWPADVWQAIDQHQVKPGMNELQADFAVGMGIPDAGDSDEQTVRYPNGGKPLVIVYHNGKAEEIKPGS
ncbi:MAG TPA: hypothetical protein VMX38_07480 [Verrucomicrobiae bacterium]|jgi:hypothetical protein|nr:hypothetical protein [Verrucomicrobiae bacterium]